MQIRLIARRKASSSRGFCCCSCGAGSATRARSISTGGLSDRTRFQPTQIVFVEQKGSYSESITGCLLCSQRSRGQCYA
jgi:hypothetical protein